MPDQLPREGDAFLIFAIRFVKNFAKYTTNDAGKALVAAGPKAE